MSKGKQFIDKAIDYYKDSYIDFHNLNNPLRYDSFIIKLHISYVCLFLEIYKKYAKQTNELKKFNKEFKNKELCLQTLLNKISNIDPEWKKSNQKCLYENLEYLIDTRNKLEHSNFTLLLICDAEKRAFNATFRNFYFCLNKHFNNKIKNIPHILQLMTYLEEVQIQNCGSKKDNTQNIEAFIKRNPTLNANFFYPASNIPNIIVNYSSISKAQMPDAIKVLTTHTKNPEEAASQMIAIIGENHTKTSTAVCQEFNHATGNTAPLSWNARNGSFKRVINHFKIKDNPAYYHLKETKTARAVTKKEMFSEMCVEYLIQEFNKDKVYFEKISKGLT